MVGEIVLDFLVADVVGTVQDKLEGLDGLLEEMRIDRSAGTFLARDTVYRDTYFFGISEIFAIEMIDARLRHLDVLVGQSNRPLKDRGQLLFLFPGTRMFVSHISFPSMNVVRN